MKISYQRRYKETDTKIIKAHPTAITASIHTFKSSSTEKKKYKWVNILNSYFNKLYTPL